MSIGKIVTNILIIIIALIANEKVLASDELK